MKTRFCYSLLLTCAAFAPTAHGQTRPENPEIYVLAGQSNMSGRGAIADLTDQERKADPSIQLFGNDGQWHVATEPLDDAHNQVDSVSRDTFAGVGPGLFFAREMRRTHRRPIVLIPCAKGGSSISQWEASSDRKSLYGSCLARIREVGAKVSGVLWYQGESDAETVARSEAWSSAFTALVGQFRKDLNDDQLPVAFVQIGDKGKSENRSAKFPAWTAVQNAQRNFVQSCTVMVSAMGLPLKEDELHLTTAAQRELGHRLTTAMLSLERQSC